jgi:peptidyl-prolyl cis-trans isomerase C
MNRYSLPVTALVAILAVVGCDKGAADQDPAAADAGPVAIVNGTEISRDVWDLFLKARSADHESEEVTPEQQQKALDNLIQMYVASQQAEKDGLNSGETAARLELMKHSALADLAGQQHLKDKDPTQEELKAEYDRQVAQMPKTEYSARHILVETEQKAREMIAALDGGAKFEALAKENSSDSSAEDGGDLGWFAPARMVKPFADAVQALEKGAYTKEPVQSQFGWHVIKLEDTRPLTPPPFEAVETQLKQFVQQSKFQAYLDELVTTAKVEKKL